MSMTITFTTDGVARCLYSEEIDLHLLGPMKVERASTIEFNEDAQEWEVRLPDGRLMFRSPHRSLCLAWEHENL